VNILIIDGCKERQERLADRLQKAGWRTDAASAATAIKNLRRQRYDAIVMAADPFDRALELCRLFRISGGMIPVLFVSGQDDVNHKESAFDAGADDYVCRSDSNLHEELVARLRKQFRRSGSMHGMTLVAGSLRLDTRLRTVSLGVKSRHLSEIECLILSYLVANAGESFTADHLFEKLWAEKTTSSQSTVRVHINSLRRKLAEMGASNFLKTNRGQGYMVLLQERTCALADCA
jgi:DNA-binding response OmpR family regulator